MLRPVIHIKSSPSAWRVNEVLQMSFAGYGEHAYFYVEKQNLNTLDVARQLAQACGVGLQQIGYAGLKDKHAVTRQWFSVPYADDAWPLAARAADASAEPEQSACISCLQTARHTHKLRHGDHHSNQFVLRLGCAADVGCAALAALNDWFPNYFGPQRVSKSNVAAARQWLAQEHQPGAQQRRNTGRSSARRKTRRGGRRGWHLSVLRSELFNAVLEQRVARGDYTEAIAGDVLQDGVPTGPLWGRGRSPASALAAEVERQALQPHKAVCDALEFTGVQQGRRALAQRPGEFVAHALAEQAPSPAGEGLTQVEVAFRLPPGAYATTLLAHRFTVRDESQPV